jgi:hypothetical protein
MKNHRQEAQHGHTLRAGIAAAVLLGASAPLSAHHSAAQYDFQTSATVSGVVKELLVENPHLKLVLEVSDENGTHAIEFEGHSRNNIYRRGWRPNLVKPGDEVTIGIAPRKDGREGGYVLSVKTADGRGF